MRAQQREVEAAAQVLASLADEHEVILTVGAEGEGMDGQMLELALRNALPDRDLLTALTQVIVSADDPAFTAPSKPASPPEPRAIAELPSLRVLVEAGVLVICAGGGVPIVIDETGTMQGVEGSIDEDLKATLLARRLDADLLVMLTDVDAVHLGGESDADRPLRDASPAELRQADLAGSMRPKVEAACRFVEATGRRAAIGSLSDAVAIARGGSGTQISPHRA